MSKNKRNTLPGFKSSVSANLTVMILFCSPTWLSSGAEAMPPQKAMPLPAWSLHLSTTLATLDLCVAYSNFFADNIN